MRIERLETGYKLTDLYITAALLCDPAMELQEVQSIDALKKPNEPADAPPRKQTMFVVKGDPSKIKAVIDAFFNGKHMVDANKFKTKVQILKSRIFVAY